MTPEPFTPPGPGRWSLETLHYGGRMTPLLASILGPSLLAGSRGLAAATGLPMGGIQLALVGDRPYTTILPPFGKADRPPPPPRAMRFVCRIHPGLRRCERAACRYFDRRGWHDTARRWEQQERPELVARIAALGAADPTALDGGALERHVAEVVELVHDGHRLHFVLHGADFAAVGDYLSWCAANGIARSAGLAALGGSSPATSAGARARPPATRSTGVDLEAPTFGELGRVAPPEARLGSAPPAQVEVPAERRPEFDRRLTEARAVYGLRDDNVVLTINDTVGLLRRTALALGRRLAAGGRVVEPAHMFESTSDELAALARGLGPGGGELAQRARRRHENEQLAAPAVLGSEPDLDLSGFTPGIRRSLGALMAFGEALQPARSGGRLHGEPIGSGSHRGVARVVGDVDEAMAHAGPGEILVVHSTSAAWNVVIEQAGGLVVETGGPLSHAAVIARELGIPAIVGVADATRLLVDGQQVELDLEHGRVVPHTL